MFGFKKKKSLSIDEMREKLRREYEIQIASGFEEQLLALARIDRMSDAEITRECRRYRLL